MRGATIEFRMPSVGATKNAMLAAVLADGTTTLKNVAMEPEVVDLANFLRGDGCEDRRARYGHDRHQRRCGAARRRVRDYRRPHRDGDAAAGGLRDPRRRTVTRCRPDYMGALVDKLVEPGVETTAARTGPA